MMHLDSIWLFITSSNRQKSFYELLLHILFLPPCLLHFMSSLLVEQMVFSFVSFRFVTFDLDFAYRRTVGFILATYSDVPSFIYRRAACHWASSAEGTAVPRCQTVWQQLKRGPSHVCAGLSRNIALCVLNFVGQRTWSSDYTPATYSGGHGLKCQPGDRLS